MFQLSSSKSGPSLTLLELFWPCQKINKFSSSTAKILPRWSLFCAARPSELCLLFRTPGRFFCGRVRLQDVNIFSYFLWTTEQPVFSIYFKTLVMNRAAYLDINIKKQHLKVNYSAFLSPTFWWHHRPHRCCSHRRQRRSRLHRRSTEVWVQRQAAAFCMTRRKRHRHHYKQASGLMLALSSESNSRYSC